METILTFDQLPEAVNQVNQKLKNIERLLLEKSDHNLTHQPDQWFNLDQLVKYDPAKRTKPTWYGLVSGGNVPYHKNGKHLLFLKSEIDDWLKRGRKKTYAEIEEEAHAYLSKK